MLQKRRRINQEAKFAEKYSTIAKAEFPLSF